MRRASDVIALSLVAFAIGCSASYQLESNLRTSWCPGRAPASNRPPLQIESRPPNASGIAQFAVVIGQEVDVTTSFVNGRVSRPPDIVPFGSLCTSGTRQVADVGRATLIALRPGRAIVSVTDDDPVPGFARPVVTFAINIAPAP